ncbi:MAG: AAA family ATPase [Deltaproteobacteria bacterium]|nr:AAA family ATPase [Deltaproteobacteria bacterium]
MYTAFYELNEKPFELTPSSRFLYLGDIHKEALALLTYGVTEKKGFILLTGEVGTGKTTMVHALLSNLDDSVQYVHLSNPMVSPKDFLKYLAYSVLKRRFQFKTKGDLLIWFENYLKECQKKRINFVLIIDEAQNLSYELLEEIRLLSNMENGAEKLLNIFLVGQPEFNAILNEPRCRPLRQRIGISYHIRPLDEQGTGEYVYKRLDLAGAKESRKLFSKEIVKALHFYSNGYPRAINVLADNLLLLGYSRSSKKLTPEMVKECYLETKYEAPQYDIELVDRVSEDISRITISSGYWKWLVSIAAGLLLVLAVGGAAYYVKLQQSAVESDIKVLKEEFQSLKTGMEENQRQILEAISSKSSNKDESGKALETDE